MPVGSLAIGVFAHDTPPVAVPAFAGCRGRRLVL
jgi:hypothetical protein